MISTRIALNIFVLFELPSATFSHFFSSSSIWHLSRHNKEPKWKKGRVCVYVCTLILNAKVTLTQINGNQIHTHWHTYRCRWSCRNCSTLRVYSPGCVGVYLSARIQNPESNPRHQPAPKHLNLNTLSVLVVLFVCVLVSRPFYWRLRTICFVFNPTESFVRRELQGVLSPESLLLVSGALWKF